MGDGKTKQEEGRDNNDKFEKVEINRPIYISV